MAIPVLKLIKAGLFCAAVVCLGCMRDVDVNLPSQTPFVVIDGWIEPKKPARLLLTLSTDFEDLIDSASYRDVVLTRAKVMLISPEGASVMTLRKDDRYFPPHIYVSSTVRGEIGGQYSVVVQFDDQESMATSTILPPIPADSLWFDLEKGQDSLGAIWLRWQDPISEQNFYRIETRVVGKDSRFVGAQISAVNDLTFDGEVFSMPIYKGLKSVTSRLDEHRFLLGDTVFVKFSSIGEVEFDFWKDYDAAVLNTGNPFAAGGANLRSNVLNGQGNWTAYGSEYYMVVCK